MSCYVYSLFFFSFICFVFLQLEPNICFTVDLEDLYWHLLFAVSTHLGVIFFFFLERVPTFQECANLLKSLLSLYEMDSLLSDRTLEPQQFPLKREGILSSFNI